MPNPPSSLVDENPGEGEIPQVPLATELLMKLRTQEDGKFSWWLLLPCVFFLGMTVIHLKLDAANAMPNVAIWFGITVLFFVGERWDRKRKRDQMVFDYCVSS